MAACGLNFSASGGKFGRDNIRRNDNANQTMIQEKKISFWANLALGLCLFAIIYIVFKLLFIPRYCCPK